MVIGLHPRIPSTRVRTCPPAWSLAARDMDADVER